MDEYGADLFNDETEEFRATASGRGWRESQARPGTWEHAGGEVLSETELRKRLAREGTGDGDAQ